MDKEKLALKVLIVVSGFPTKVNPSRSSFNLVAAKSLSAKHEVTILRFRAWKPGRKILEKKKIDNLSMLIIAFPLLNLKWLQSLCLNHFFLALVLKSKIRELPDIDIIHCVGGGLTSYASYIISEERSVPYINQYIGSDVNFYLTNNFGKRIIRKYIQSASYHIFNSKQLLITFTKYFPNIQNKKVIYRGINLKNINIKLKTFNKIKILFLGGLVSGDYGKHTDNLKGGVNLLKAWSKLDRTHDLSKVELFFGGPNSENHKKYLDISTLICRNSFHLIGEISKNEVEKYMLESNIVIIPSLFEGLPNVAFEAMAYGNMIIGTKVGGIPEIVDDKCGILIEPNDVDEIVKALQYAISNLNFVINSAIEGKQKIKKFDSSNFLVKYSEVYKEVTNQDK